MQRSFEQNHKYELSAVDAAEPKWCATELQQRFMGRCLMGRFLQLHRRIGYMREHRIAHVFVDARTQTIYGRTTGAMNEVIGRERAPATTARPHEPIDTRRSLLPNR